MPEGFGTGGEVAEDAAAVDLLGPAPSRASRQNIAAREVLFE